MKNNITLIFLLLFVTLLIISCNTSFNKDEKKPNILFIMSDDHAYQAISAYDDRLIQTPNIDRIAEEGMLFTNASVTNSICAPSRAVILTGKHSHINGKIDNRGPFNHDQQQFSRPQKQLDRPLNSGLPAQRLFRLVGTLFLSLVCGPVEWLKQRAGEKELLRNQ